MPLFHRLKTALSGWPSDVPNYFPRNSASEIAEFMSEDEFQRIKKFDVASILPFASRDSEASEVAFGLGVSHQLIRNLMLLSDISIRGPEDTPQLVRENVPEISRARQILWVTGRVSVVESAYQLEYEVWHDGEVVSSNVVRDVDFSGFLYKCSGEIALSLGSRCQCTVEDAWKSGQPDSPDAILQYGALVLSHSREDSNKRTHATIALMEALPKFGLIAWQLANDLAVSRKWILKGIERDPNNAHLHFEAFCSVWSGRGPEPWAVQLCRKAIELSPGLGKAHMCLPHATLKSAKVLNHSELGYRLLKGNPFAVNNYILQLRKRGDPTNQQLIDLAQEGIDHDPKDPGNYDRLIDLFVDLKQYEPALEFAKRKLALFYPEMNDRALYCVRQVTWIREEMDAGRYDPVEEAMNVVAKLQKRVK